MKDTGFKTRLGQITKIKSQSGEPIEFESGQVIINKVSTKKNLKKLVDINNDTSKKTSVKVTDDATVGGLLEGPPHYDKKGNDVGGIPGIVDGNKQIEVEGQEFVVNKEASKKHWRELSKINQSAGNGVPIGPPIDYDEDPKEYKEGGRVIDFNPNHVPSKKILNYAKKIKQNHPEIWKLGGNIFGNEAFVNLKRVSERGYWLDSEEWMYIKWRSYVARHIHDFRIEGVIAMLKWVDKVEKGWPYMKNLIEQEIAKREGKESDKMAKGGVITYKHKYNKKYGYEKNQSHDLEQISKDTGVSLEGLQEIYNKGIGAFKTNPESVRPNVKSKEQWAMARVYSAVMGGKASKIDSNELKMSKGGSVEKDATELSEILMEHLNEYCIYYYNSELDPDSFMMKTEKGENGHKVKELSGMTKNGIDVHISIEQLYMKNGGNVDAKDTITLDVPLMIRLLELSREDIKSDAELHFLVEKLIELKNKPVLTMDDYAFIADLEHNHLKKFDLGGKVNPGQREVDLGFGGLGNGTTVWDRNRIENNDYKIVAHISNSGNVTYYDKNLPEDAKNKIEEMAMKERQGLENQNGLSSGYEFMPINTPLN